MGTSDRDGGSIAARINSPIEGALSMADLGGMADKAKDAAQDHPEQVDQAKDKAKDALPGQDDT